MRQGAKSRRRRWCYFGFLWVVILSTPGDLLDPHEVTNRAYLRFVQATGRPAPEYWLHGRFPDGLGEEPVVLVTWHDAVAYCRWAGGKRLPTVDEWMKSCRAGKLEKKGDVWEWTSTEMVAPSGLFIALCGPKDFCDCSHQYLPDWKNSVKGFRCGGPPASLTAPARPPLRPSS